MHLSGVLFLAQIVAGIDSQTIGGFWQVVKTVIKDAGVVRSGTRAGCKITGMPELNNELQ